MWKKVDMYTKMAIVIASKNIGRSNIEAANWIELNFANLMKDLRWILKWSCSLRKFTGCKGTFGYFLILLHKTCCDLKERDN